MRKLLLAPVLLAFSMSASAEAPGGPGCGWGNMIFEGSSGLGVHLVATIVNGTSGNKTFGMTSGTNGCSTDGVLTYGGENLLTKKGVLEEVAHDMAAGDGEALTALSVSMGIEPADRPHFKAVMHDNFSAVYPHESVTAQEVMDNIVSVMHRDPELSGYVS